jgi:valyl-tRNA synthetase
MSKSLGNSPDALELIDNYSADGVRVGLLLSNAAGNDLLFDEALCQQGKGFSNKIWNAFKLITSWEVSETIEQPESSKTAIQWYEAVFQDKLRELEDHYSKYRISDALMTSYKLVWDDFCSWFLEIIKPGYEQPVDTKTLESAIALFEDNLKILHPFMPFVTEEIWHQIAERKPSEALTVSLWPEQKKYDSSIISEFAFIAEVISGIRTIRKDKNIAFKNEIDLLIINNESVSKAFDTVITKMGNLQNLTYVDSAIEGSLTFRVKSNEYFIPVEGAIDVEAERVKLKEELQYYEGFLISVDKKLANERFVNNAPEQVVNLEKQKKADALAQIQTITASLENL